MAEWDIPRENPSIRTVNFTKVPECGELAIHNMLNSNSYYPAKVELTKYPKESSE